MWIDKSVAGGAGRHNALECRRGPVARRARATRECGLLITRPLCSDATLRYNASDSQPTRLVAWSVRVRSTCTVWPRLNLFTLHFNDPIDAHTFHTCPSHCAYPYRIPRCLPLWFKINQCFSKFVSFYTCQESPLRLITPAFIVTMHNNRVGADYNKFPKLCGFIFSVNNKTK